MSCWSEVERENRRMWDEYTDSTHSVLIRTTAHRLVNSLTYARYIALHRIQYSDKPYLEACEPGISEITRTSLLYKTDSFSWEREVRLLAEPDIRISKVTSNSKVSWDPSVHGDPKQLHVEPRILIDQVRTHPDSDQSLRDRLQALHADHGLTVPVRPSVLERDHTPQLAMPSPPHQHGGVEPVARDRVLHKPDGQSGASPRGGVIPT